MLSELFVKISANFDQLNKSFDKVQEKMDTFGEKATSIGETLTTALTLPLAVAGGASIKLASDTNEALNKVKVSFGKSAQDVIAWSKTSVDKMGIAGLTALDTAALFGDMGTSMGLTQEDAAKMSMTLTNLGVDLASFKNVSIDQAMHALSGIFTGETESLKNLGYVMTETNLQAFALTNGINKKVESMTQAEKVTLRYAYMLSVTKNAQGDFLSTFFNFANQLRVFGESLKELGVLFGQVLLSSLTEMLIKVNGFLKSLQNLSPEMKKTIVITGIFAAAIGPLALAIGGLITILPILKNGLLAIAPAIKSIGTALKFLATNPIGIAIMAISALVAGVIYFYNTNETFRGVVDSIFISLSNVLSNLWKNVIVPIGSAIKNLWINIFVPLGNYISEFLSPTIKMLSAFFTFLWKQVLIPFGNSIVKDFTGNINFMINAFEFLRNSVLKPLANFFINNFGPIFGILTRIISTHVNNFQNAYINIMNFLTGVFSKNWSSAWLGIQEIFVGVFKIIITYAQTSVQNIINALSYGFQQGLSHVRSILLKGVDAILSGIGKLTSWIPGFEEKLSKAREGVRSLIDSEKIKRDSAELKLRFIEVEASAVSVAQKTEKAKASVKSLGETKRVTAQYTSALDEMLKKLSETMNIGASSSSKATKAEKEYKTTVGETTEAIETANDTRVKKYEELVSKLDKLGDAITNALKNKYAEQERIDTKALSDRRKKEIDSKKELMRISQESYDNEIKKLKNKSKEEIDILQDNQKTKLLLLNTQTIDQLNSLQEQIDSINDLTDKEEKALDEQAYNVRIAELEKELASAESYEERIRIQQKLNEETLKRQRELVLEERKIQIDSLRKRMEEIQKSAEEERAQMELETQRKIQQEEIRIDNVLQAESEKFAILQNSQSEQLKSTEEFFEEESRLLKEKYEKATEQSALFAEAQKMATQKNQSEIINLLSTYNPQWQDAGKSFGQSLLDGLNSTKASIQSAVADILSQINVAKDLQSQLSKQTTTAPPTPPPQVQKPIPPATPLPPNTHIASLPPASARIGDIAPVVTSPPIYFDGKRLTELMAPHLLDSMRKRLGTAY